MTIGQTSKCIGQAVNGMDGCNGVMCPIVCGNLVHIALTAPYRRATGELFIERFAFRSVFSEPYGTRGIVFKATLCAKHSHTHRPRVSNTAKFIDARGTTIGQLEQRRFIAEGIIPLI